MNDFKQICKFCNEIKLSLRYRDKTIILSDILSNNLCPLAFNSIYPYMLTLSTGGWFSWVNYKEAVIVNCPAQEGIAMYVRVSAKGPSIAVEAEVMKKNENCHKRYNLKDNFIFTFNEENREKFKLLYNIIPFIFSKDEISGFSFTIDGEKLSCSIESC